MQAACNRCRQKKTRCDRGEGGCNRCQNAEFLCVYPPLRQRSRSARRSDDRPGVGSESGGGQGGMLPPLIEAVEDTQLDSAPQAPRKKPAFPTPESSRHEDLTFFREYADFMNVLPVMEIGFNKATDGISLYRYSREQMIDVVGDPYLGMKIYDDLQSCRYAKCFHLWTYYHTPVL
ncbi:hypothetical protein FQN50_000390 [Emmonsiellopsis sp. PD_5]|nr:hypothetical protein FQN50_000390 [Emmonsiellopsis sp. PD_5]